METSTSQQLKKTRYFSNVGTNCSLDGICRIMSQMSFCANHKSSSNLKKYMLLTKIMNSIANINKVNDKKDATPSFSL